MKLLIMFKSYYNFSILLLSLFLFACSAGKQITQLSEEAEIAYQQGDFSKALEKYEQALELNKDHEKKAEKLFEGAGLAAFALKDYSKSLEYLEKVRFSSFAGGETYYSLSLMYRDIDNLSREISSLKAYVNNFPEGQYIDKMQARLFETLVESENYEDALELWKSMEDSLKKDEGMLTTFLIANRETNNEALSDRTANELIKLNKDNPVALDWLAKKHFWLAENRYQEEMKAYEKNKSRRQYAQLLAEFEILNRDFRTSLNYFLRLYEINPTSEYAQYIGNIYTRFDDKQKANEYHRRAKQ
jgi:tetratricopeptide (TPR) repeat protein